MKLCRFLGLPALLLVVFLGGFLAYYPHLNYPYPIHVDEWNSIAFARSVQKGEILFVKEPFTGERQVRDMELGFHSFLAGLQKAGLDWLTLFRFGPAILFALLIIAAYFFGAKKGYGVEAAFFTALIPSSLRLTGPQFFVPVSLGAVLFLAALYLAFYCRTKKSYAGLFMLSLSSLLIHPLTALVLFFVFLIFVAFNIRKEKAHCRNLLLIILLTLLSALPIMVFWLSPLVNSGVFTGGHYLTYLQEVFKLYGIAPAGLFVFGSFVLAYKKNYTLVASSLLLLLLIVLFARYGFGLYILYDRSYIYLFILMSLIAGFALSKFRKVNSALARTLYAIFIILVLFPSLRASLNESHYHIIDDRQYGDFVWIRDYVPGERAILDPWLAKAFTPITGKHVYSHLPQAPDREMERRIVLTERFFREGCKNMSFLKENNISIIYGECNSSELAELKKNVYLARWA